MKRAFIAAVVVGENILTGIKVVHNCKTPEHAVEEIRKAAMRWSLSKEGKEIIDADTNFDFNWGDLPDHSDSILKFLDPSKVQSIEYADEFDFVVVDHDEHLFDESIEDSSDDQCHYDGEPCDNSEDCCLQGCPRCPLVEV